MSDLFEKIIPSILETKKNYIVDEITEKSYSAFMVNRALSNHIDCLDAANKMNMNYSLPNKMQYDFHFHSIRAYRRPFQKWHKKVEEKDLESLKLYFGYSSREARKTIESGVLSKDQLDFIRKQTQID